MDLKEAIELIGQMMAISAITAPKSKGENFVTVEFITGKKLRKIGEAMIERGKKASDPFYIRDGESILKSDALLLIGIKDAKPVGLNCGGCGFERCIRKEEVKEMRDFRAPVCMFRILDMGIAIGSAVKTASIHNIDNRIMYRAAVVARELGYTDSDIVMGIPLSVSGKSIYFDRKVPEVK